MPLRASASGASRVGLLVLACLILGGCDWVGFDGSLPTLAELTAEFETPAPGTAVIRTGDLRGGDDVVVSAQALGVDESDTFLYIVFCDGESEAGGVYDAQALYASLQPGLELNTAQAGFRGSGRGTIHITDIADDGAVSGLFAVDVRSELELTRRRVQGAFNARPVGPAYTCGR